MLWIIVLCKFYYIFMSLFEANWLALNDLLVWEGTMTPGWSITPYHGHVKGLKNVKCTLVQALRLCTGRTARRGSRGIALFFLDHGTRRGWGVSVTPWPLFTPGKTRYPLYRRLGGPQGRSGQLRKISPPPGFHPRTVQSVASSYTDWTTRPTGQGVDSRW